MKNIKYLLLTVIALITTVGCVEDDLMDNDQGPIVSSVIKLNEIMSTGSPDWIELYNSGTEDINLLGYFLKDSNTKWEIPNVTIPAGGFVTFDCDGLDANGSTSFKISSGGETITLFNTESETIDEVTTPDMSAQVGLSYGREVDGGEIWIVQSPTKGTANSSVNNPPILIAEPMTEFTSVYAVVASDADGIASVKLVHMINDGVQSFDMALVDGEYKTSVPRANVGDVVNYYVVATDNKGLTTYYPENGTEEPATFTVVGGIEELLIEGEEAGFRGNVTFTAAPYYVDQVDEIRLYYLLPGEQQDDVNDDKTKVVLTKVGDAYEGIIPPQATDDVVRYYLRVEYLDGTKTYYPIEEEGSDFNHDYGTTWPSYTVEAITYDDVVEKTVNSTEGPLTSIKFPTNPIPGTDINIVVTYESTVEITEARIYFDVGETPVYVKGNKIKGEDDGSFTQTGVTLNFKGVVADNGSEADATGEKVSFYIRIQDVDGNEYYYSNDGSMYLDNTGAGGTTDDSDEFKGDTSLWNVYNVQ
jgi:hypothetical protein